MKTKQCEKCGKRFKRLTKENLCVFCFKKKFGKWSEEFMMGKKENKFKGNKK